jgi:hypothetical protein
LIVNEAVDVRHGGGDSLFPARVATVMAAGEEGQEGQVLYAIDYEDGDVEEAVERRFIIGPCFPKGHPRFIIGPRGATVSEEGAYAAAARVAAAVRVETKLYGGADAEVFGECEEEEEE